MIIAFNREPPELKEVVEVSATPEERERNLKEMAEFRANVDWFTEHAADIYGQHSGKYMVVLGQELFVGDDSKEVRSRAFAAHPECSGGSLSKRLSTHRGPMIYANHR